MRKYTVRDLENIARENGFRLDSRKNFQRAEELLERLNHKSVSVAPGSKVAAINQYARDNKITLSSEKAYADAEEGARKQYPEIFGLRSNESERGSSIQRRAERLIFNEGDAGLVRVECKGWR